MNLKKGDQVTVLAGKDRGKSGKVVSVDNKTQLVVVEGINIRTRFERSRRQNQKGQKVLFPSPLHPSKLMLICPSCGKLTRVGHTVNEAGRKLRVCKKCKSTF